MALPIGPDDPEMCASIVQAARRQRVQDVPDEVAADDLLRQLGEDPQK